MVFDRDSVDTLFVEFSRATVTDFGASQRLQLQHHVFENVGHVGPAPQSLKKAPALANATAMFDQSGEPALEPVIEAGDHLRGGIFQPSQINPDFENWKVCPSIGAAEGEHFSEGQRRYKRVAGHMLVLRTKAAAKFLRTTAQKSQ